MNAVGYLILGLCLGLILALSRRRGVIKWPPKR